MQCRCTIKQYWTFFHDLRQNIPDFWSGFFDLSSGAFNIVSIPLLNQLAHDKRFEEFQCHMFGQTAFMKLQFRPHNYDRTATVIYTFA